MKEIASRPTGQRCIVSICTDGGQGAVVLLEAAPNPNQEAQPTR